MSDRITDEKLKDIEKELGQALSPGKYEEKSFVWAMDYGRKLIAELKRLRKGPSEEDKERLLKYDRRHITHIYDDADGVCYKCWALSLLKKYMEIG